MTASTPASPAASVSTPQGVTSPRPEPTLRQRTIAGSAWTIGAQLGTHGLRFVNNMILVRLLAQEVFGLMAMIMLVIQAAEMCSGIGSRAAILHHPRGDDPDFLNTVWTMQLARSVAVWGVVCLLALPASWFYEQPALAILLPIIGLTRIVDGLESTSRFTLLRHVRPGPNVTVDLTSDVVAAVVTIGWAWLHPTIWAIVGGMFVKHSLRTWMTWRLIPGYTNRLSFNRDAARDLFRFGRWVFLGTLIMFLLAQGDRLVLAKILSVEELAVYAIAAMIILSADQVIRQLANNVLQPLYARLRERGEEALRTNTLRVRAGVLACAVPMACVLVVSGQPLVRVLYPASFHGAGWMIEMLAIGLVASAVTVSAEQVLLACGDSFRQMLMQLFRVVLFFGCTFGGLWLADVPGFILGISVARFLEYPLLALMIHRYGVWLPWLDLAAAAFAGAFVLVVTQWTGGLGWPI